VTFVARPPAKVNLTLGVFGRRADGFHELVSVFLRVGLTDRLTIQPGAGPGDRLTVSGATGVPTDGNLVLKAIDAVRAEVGGDLPPLDVTLDKRIPVAAGLGGGSSDAASAVRLSQAAWGVRLASDQEIDVTRSLGSDVPFFQSGATAGLIEGRGERVTSLPSYHIESMGILLVMPAIPLSTAQVFQRFDELGGAETATASEMNEEIVALMHAQPTNTDVMALAAKLRDANDLWSAAASLEPSLGDLRDALEQASGRPWQMSGSGSTLFALYASADEAAEAGRSLVRRSVPELQSAVINAVDLVGPDPISRHP
jgi:4-diphosphocytidyl-2-C-methyl-D-erythritol kinase